jgi:hypothetical protein
MKYPRLWMIVNRILCNTGGPNKARADQTPARWDYLCGYWLERPRTRWRRRAKRRLDRALGRPPTRPSWPPPGRRVGGIGFDCVGELVGDTTPPTSSPDGRQCTQIDGFVVNAAWRDRIVPDSFCVQPRLDPEHPDSDHLAVRVAIDI